MPTADRVLALKLISDVGDINKQMKGVSGRYKKMSDSAKSWGKAFAAGFVIDGIQGVSNALGDAWAGFRSGERVAAQLGNTWKNLGMDGSALAATLQEVTDSTLRLGTSDDEAVAAFTQSIKFTRSYDTSLKHLKIAQDLVANGSAPDLASAFKIIQQASKGSARVVDRFGLTSDTAAGRVRELGKQVAGAARKAAKKDGLAVTMNAIAESTESFVGSLSGGDLQGALDSLADIGGIIEKGLFGDGKKDKGAVGRFGEIGTKLKDSIIEKLSSLDLSQVFGKVVYALQTNGDVLAAIGITALALGAAFQGAMFVASLFATAAAAVFAAPGFVIGGAVHIAAGIAAGAIGTTIALSMWAVDLFISAATGVMKSAAWFLGGAVNVVAGTAGAAMGAAFSGAMFLASTMASWAWSAVTTLGTNGRLIGAAANAGRILGKIVGRNLVIGAVLAVAGMDVLRMVADAIRGKAKELLGIDLGPIGFPGLGSYASGTKSARGGWSMVGERGPELMNMRSGATVLNARDTMSAMSGSGPTVIQNFYTPVDPVAVGRETDRVLRAFYRRSGGVTAR